MTKSRALPPLERVRKFLEYDPETGHLAWRVARSGWVKAGRQTGALNGKGHHQVRIDGTLYYAHRLAWLLYHGKDPGNLQVDHVNGDKADNRIANLRLATNTENQHNLTRLQSNSTSGVTGVNWDKRERKWRARIQLGGQLRHLGYFDSIERAATARRAAELEHFGEFAPRLTV